MNYNSYLTSRFLGKTGTLKGVRSLSGLLDLDNNPLFVSIISNNVSNDDDLIESVLSKISQNNTCY